MALIARAQTKPNKQRKYPAVNIKEREIIPVARFSRAIELKRSSPESAPICAPLRAENNNIIEVMRRSEESEGDLNVCVASQPEDRKTIPETRPPLTRDETVDKAMNRRALTGSFWRYSATNFVAVTPNPKPAKS